MNQRVNNQFQFRSESGVQRSKMADDKPDLESLQRRRLNTQRSLTTRINRLNVNAGCLGAEKLSQELAELANDYDVFVDASNDYIEELGQIDPTDDNCELSNALATRDAIVRRYRGTMEILWFKDAKPEIEALVTQFNSAFDQVEVLRRENILPWSQKEATGRQLDRKLNRLRQPVYAWKGYIPYGKEKWTLLLALEDEKEALMDKWACRGEMNATTSPAYERNEEDSSERSEEEDKGSEYTSTTPLVPIHSHSAIREGAMETGCGTSPLNGHNNLMTDLLSVSLSLQPRSTPRPPRLHTAPANTSMAQGSTVNASTCMNSSLPQIKFTPINLPRFSGESRDYWRWKAEWAKLQAHADPSGSQEIRRLQLLSEPVKKALRLYRCKDVSDVFKELESCYGDIAATVEDILLELHSKPFVKDPHPRETLEMVSDLENAVSDLTDLGWEEAMNNPLVMGPLEGRLPKSMQTQWLKEECNAEGNALPGTRVKRLLLFLQSEKKILRRLARLPSEPGKPRPTHASERPNHREKSADCKRERTVFTRATAAKVITCTRYNKQKLCAHAYAAAS